MNARTSRLTAWRHQHAWCVRDSLRRLGAHPLGTGLTVIVMGLALALPLAFYLLLTNVQHLAVVLGNSQAVSVFLKPAIHAEAAETLAQKLRTRTDVDSITLRTPEQGLTELAKLQGFGAAIHVLDANPLPFVLLVEPRAGSARTQVEVMARDLRQLPEVDLVQDNGRWRARLAALVGVGQRVAWLLAGLLAAAAVLVIGNTVRLDIRGRAEEIAVQQWVGANAAFVRRPYLYEGVWYGLAAGGVAVLLVLAMEAALAQPVRELVASYAGRVYFNGLAGGTFASVIALAVVLGWLGAFIASSRHLAHARP